MNDLSGAESLGKIAVIGMAGRYPGARNPEEFWRNLKDGKECISFFTDEELLQEGIDSALLGLPNYVKAQGVYEGTYLFDAPFFGYTPREAELIDPQHRVFLECAWEALESAGYDAGTYPGRIGVFAGAGMARYFFELFSMPEIRRYTSDFVLATCNEKDFLATRVGYKLNLRGPCITVQTACSTSLVSIVMAAQSLLTYQSDMVLAGGVRLTIPERSGYLYMEGGIHSPDGHCRTFDANAGGTLSGSGAGIVVLKRLKDALNDGDTVHAVILGFGLNNDGSSRIGFTSPGVEGQVAVVLDAIAMADINPETVGAVECHGTATAIGDPIEIAGLIRAFRAYTDKKRFCAVGSVKTNIGHTDAAAGVAGFTKMVLALKHRALPPSLHFSKPNPEIDFESSPFFVNTQLREWTRGSEPLRAGVTSLGAGGTNAHVILEEPPAQPPFAAHRPWHLLVWSALTESSLQEMDVNMRRHLQEHGDQCIADVAYTLQVGRRQFPYRRAIVCRNHQDAIGALGTATSDKVLTAFREEQAGPVTFLFPGQGPQYVQMGKELYLNQRVFHEEVDRCAEILKPELGLDLRDVLYPLADESKEASETLNQIKYTTPILFTVEYALAKLWMSWGVRPECMIGHSTGEYAAACVAGVFSLQDALHLVSARGRFMQQLPRGSMMGVLLSEEQLRPLLAEIGQISVAAVNGPSVCVASGPNAAVDRLERMLQEKAVPFRRLHISHASHSEMMDPILKDFRKEVEGISLHAPKLPYFSNLSGSRITSEVAANPEYWTMHLRNTVRFSDSAAELLKDPKRIFLEVGPGHMLCSLVLQHPGRSNSHVVLPSLPHPKDDPQTDMEFLVTTLGQLWLEGVRIDWSAIYAEEKRRRIVLPTYPFERRHYQLTTSKRRFPAANIAPGTGLGRPDNENDTSTGHPGSERPRAAEHGRPRLSVAYVAPRNELEQTIAALWQNTLGITPVGVNDSFIALGGHSLLALQIIAQIRSSCEIGFSVKEFYEAGTVARQAAAIVRLLIGEMSTDEVTKILVGVVNVKQSQGAAS